MRYRYLVNFETLSWSPCTTLKVGVCLLFGLCKGTVSGLCKMMEFPISHVRQQCILTWANPNIYLDQPITKCWCRSIGGYVSYPIDGPTAIMLGLCNSLLMLEPLCWQAYMTQFGQYRREDPEMGSFTSIELYRMGLIEFQRMAGIPQTGTYHNIMQYSVSN